MSITRIRAVALLLAGLVALIACSATGTAQDSPPAAEPTLAASAPSRLLAPAGFADAIREPDRTTINVHVPFEGTLARTDLMIPYDEVTRRASALPADRTRPLAVYCKSGNMSRTAARALAALGYTNVVELDGGMDAWAASGRPVLRSPPGGWSAP